MLKVSRGKFPPATVPTPLPDVDRGKGDPRNVIAVIKSVTEDGFYQVGNADGTLRNLLSRYQFMVNRERIVELDAVTFPPKGLA